MSVRVGSRAENSSIFNKRTSVVSQRRIKRKIRLSTPKIEVEQHPLSLSGELIEAISKVLSTKESCNRKPVFVTHYTINTPYRDIVGNLVKSLERFKLDYEIEEIKSLGSWRMNSNYCATCVQKMLKKHGPRPIVKVDADAVVQRYPALFEMDTFDADIAACIWKKNNNEFLGGTLFFANNPKVCSVVDRWVNACSAHPKERNPLLLDKIIKDRISEIKFVPLPLEYCKIFDLMANEVKEPVIEHFQASRKYRNTIK